MERYICIHGHFYQPPRENPWLEEVELQDSAYPYHDWNERVTAECYAPNTASRILDPEGRIIDIVNLYSKISFNFGPTLFEKIERVMKMLRLLPVKLNIWKAQNTYFTIGKNLHNSMSEKAGKGNEFAERWLDIFHRVGYYIQVRVL